MLVVHTYYSCQFHKRMPRRSAALGGPLKGNVGITSGWYFVARTRRR